MVVLVSGCSAASPSPFGALRQTGPAAIHAGDRDMHGSLIKTLPDTPGQTRQYTGVMGAGTGDVTITEQSATRYLVTVTAATSSGFGYVNGTAHLSRDGVLQMDDGVKDSGQRAQCRLTIQPYAAAVSALSVSDHGCVAFQSGGVLFQGIIRPLRMPGEDGYPNRTVMREMRRLQHDLLASSAAADPD